MTLQTLLGKRVREAEGTCLGRVHGFCARWEGDRLQITHIRVGQGAWVQRLQPPPILRRLLGAAAEFEIPWEAIASLDAAAAQIHLKPEWNLAHCEGCRILPA